MTKHQPSALADKILLRLPPGMKERLTAAAQGAGRSINTEVISRLEQSLDRFSTLEKLISDVDDLKAAVFGTGGRS